MRSRVARLMIAALLLAVGVGAALQINFLLAQSHQLAERQRTVLLLLARIDALAGDLAGTQAAYVAPGQPDAPWLERASTLTTELTTTISALRAAARSSDAPSKTQVIADGLARLTMVDASARRSLQQDQDLMVADLIFGEGRNAVNAIHAGDAELAAAESSTFEQDRERLQQRILLIAGAAAIVGVIGLLVLVPLPRERHVAAAYSLVGPTDRASVNATDAAPHIQPVIDLTAAADLCTALSRVDSSAALPDMLARASALLDASGIIVWLASGNGLVAATSHGYDPRIINRLGSIAHDADNATAAAWRAGEIRTVAGDVMSNGAIVAPMFGPDTCIGVLAVEVRHGREEDGATRAVTMMVAAQLATVFGTWTSAPPARAAEG
jgi:hypothetical protein